MRRGQVAAGKAEEGLFERSGGRARFYCGGSIEGDEAPFLKNGYAIGEQFDFRKRV